MHILSQEIEALISSTFFPFCIYLLVLVPNTYKTRIKHLKWRLEPNLVINVTKLMCKKIYNLTQIKSSRYLIQLQIQS